MRAYLRRVVARLGAGQVEAVISAWPLFPVFGTCHERVRVYRAQDDFVAGAALLGFNAQHLDSCERRVAASADFIVATNPVVADNWRARGADVRLIPYGADVNAYTNVDQAPLAVDVGLDDPVVGFVGHINSRIDMRILEAIAGRGRSLLLVGPKDPAFETQRFDALAHRANVRWVGPKPFHVLPSYFRAIDVGAVPYGDSPFNRGSFPLKTLEYLAALGCRVDGSARYALAEHRSRGSRLPSPKPSLIRSTACLLKAGQARWPHLEGNSQPKIAGRHAQANSTTLS